MFDTLIQVDRYMDSFAIESDPDLEIDLLLDQIFQDFDLITLEIFEETMSNFGNDSKGKQISKLYQSMFSNLVENTENWMEVQNRYYQQQMQLWLGMFGKQTGAAIEPVAKPEKTDRRFSAPEWEQYPFFDYLKQFYLITSNWMIDLVEKTNVDEDIKRKLRFYTRQYVDALSPTNFAATNPEVIKLAIETKGESISSGLKNLLEDLEKGRISMTDEGAFEVGKNLATTEGAVVYRHELFELIQYKPLTEQVSERPLLIVPPCINKYYILDLQAKNSFVRYAVAEGHTVLLVSWRNVPEELGAVTFDQYVSAVHDALTVSVEIGGVEKVNALGFCIGGALLTTALAILRAQKQMPVASVTLLTTLLDYSDPGEISVFIDEELVNKREVEFKDGGLVSGRELAATFSSLRANDLIWFYVVNNYLKGKTPDAFDILYWNSDSTNLPGTMYAYYLRNFYFENNLRKPNALTLCNTPVDISKINVPTYIFAAREDHIVPWKTAYESTQILSGKLEFVLGASGHIAGVVNPASANKRNYWVNGVVGPDADQWLATAESVPGSWWTHWMSWLKQKGGKQIPARAIGTEKYQPIEAAPGSYVKVRCED